jgi:solute:Na+ symporter, SSS family
MIAPFVLAQATTDGSLSGHWTGIDWGVLVGYLVITTWLGHRLAGKQATIRDFFLGGRKLPWYAVTGSIIATEISALTFISVPFVVFRDGGNFEYLQLGVFGSLFSRLIVAWVLVPAYYRREIYSPYDYMGNQLGSGVRSLTTVLFVISGLLAQSARVYLTAVVLQLILRDQLNAIHAWTGISPLVQAIYIIGFVAVLWTIIGGIATVIWTDVILFFVFLAGAMISLAVVAYHLPGGFIGGLGEIFRVGAEYGKFSFFDLALQRSPADFWSDDLTIWTAVIASTWGGIGAYGTDQLMAQRMFCCKGPRDAKIALIASWFGQIVTFTVALVGVGLFAYYLHNPLTGEARAAYEAKGDRIFPIFILSVIPTGLTGLIIAGVFAAAISSLDSILAALSQTTMSAFYIPWRERLLKRRELAAPRGFAVGLPGDALTAPENPSGAPGEPATMGMNSAAEQRHTVLVSRVSIVFWGIALCAMAQLADVASRYFGSLLQLGLSMAGYVGGSLLAGFLLGFLRLGINGRGYLFSAPLSVLTIFAIAWYQDWTRYVTWIGGAALLTAWLVTLPFHRVSGLTRAWQTAALLAGIGIMLLISHYGHFTRVDPETGVSSTLVIAWPWWTPIGSLVAFVWGYLLAGPKESEPAEPNHV